MIAAAISDFRAHITKYLKLISKGKEIVITLRGKEVARVIPPENKKTTARKKLKQLSETAVIKNIIDPVSAEWKMK